MESNCRLIVLVFVMCFACFEVSAAGFQLAGHSVVQVGRASAGGSLAGDDLSAAFDNPAEMMLFENNRFQLSVNRNRVSFPFTNAGSTQNLLGTDIPSTGGDSDGGTIANIPSVLFVFGQDKALKYGLAVTAPFGLRTEYDPAWVGRYHVIEAGLTVIDINPSIAYRINGNLSIGAGLSAQYIETELSEAIYTGGEDGLAEIKGDNWGYGFNTGLMYVFDGGAKVSFSYRSSIEHALDGTLKTSRLTGALSVNNGTVGAKTNINLPETISINTSVPLSSDLTLLATASQTRWSRFKEIRITLDGNLPDNVITAHWRDTWRYSLGSQLKLNQRWILRAGLLWDQSPLSGSSNALPHIPDSDRFGVHVGGSYIPASSSWRFDIAYAHISIDDVAMDRTIELVPGMVSDRLAGEYNDSQVDIITAQASSRF